MILDELFDGKYKIIKVLGKGGMGTVFLAENIKLGTLWAIKEIDKSKNSSVDILVESNILKKLNHPSLPRIFDIIEDENYIFIIVDYIEGTPLEIELARVGKFPEDTVVQWALQICKVLTYLHSQLPHPIIYRDMKPSNMILTNNGTLKLIDFGIAREFKIESNSDTVYIGTRGYAAPEQYGVGQTNERTDIYSTGVTLYHLLTGKSPVEPPFEIKSLRTLDPGFSKGIEIVINKCTRIDPEQRYASVQELQEDLENQCGLTEAINYEKNKQSEVTRSHSFQKLILTVLGDSEFACEMGFIISKLTDLKVLIINLDFMSSKVDLYLNLVPQIDRYVKNRNENFGLTFLLEEMKGNRLNSEMLESACMKSNDSSNLFVLIDNYSISNGEELKEFKLNELIECAYRSFDVTLLVVNNSIYDPFNKTALERSDINIVAIPANVDEIRYYESYFQYMTQKFRIDSSKTRFIAFDYKKEINLSETVLNNFFGGKSFIGTINYHSEREKYRNLNSFYAKVALEMQVEEYISILEKFNIFPKKTVADKFNRWISGMFKK